MLKLEQADKEAQQRLGMTERQAKMQGRDASFLIGVPKDFESIVRISSQLDVMPVASKDRILAIKELSVYANSGP